MSRELVQKFYELIWNPHDKSAIPGLLNESFTFRGSLGSEIHGRYGFIDYLDMVHEALFDYECIIKETVSESDKVFTRMQFTGIHKDLFMGYQPTGQRLTWDGAALFPFQGREDYQSLGTGRLEEIRGGVRWI